jgi:hypothetical protein
MIALLNRFAAFPNGMFDFNASHDGRFGWFLLTWHPEDDPVLEEIQTKIKLDIRNSALGQTSKVEIETWLKTFFMDYHWKLHAVFRKTNLKEKGISLFLAVMFDHELFIIEFGRMLSGVCDKVSIEPVGRSWTNFHVKSLDEMALLGMSEKDISVKPKRFLLPENQCFIALPSAFTEKLQQQDYDCATLDTILQSIFEDTNGCYFILDGKAKLTVKKHPRLRRFQLSALVIILISVSAIIYMQFGNRWLESTGRKLKLILNSKSRLSVDQLPQYLNTQSANLKKQLQRIERIANQPARNIKLARTWQTDLNFLITAAPAFDINNIYIASENKLLAFDKATKKLVWSKVLDANITEITAIRGNLIVFLENQTMVCLKNGNQISWTKPLTDRLQGKLPLAPFEINTQDEPRIYGSILIVPMQKGIYINDVYSGELYSSIEFERRLQYLSGYDAFNNCFYAVVADQILCISLEITS